MAFSRLGGEDQRRLPDTNSRTPGLCGGPGRRGCSGRFTAGIQTRSALRVQAYGARLSPAAAVSEHHYASNQCQRLSAGGNAAAGDSRAPEAIPTSFCGRRRCGWGQPRSGASDRPNSPRTRRSGGAILLWQSAVPGYYGRFGGVKRQARPEKGCSKERFGVGLGLPELPFGPQERLRVGAQKCSKKSKESVDGDWIVCNSWRHTR